MSSTPTPEIQLTIDGRQVSVPAGTTIFDAARMNGIPIPTLCHQQNENPVGVCRVCVVDVGERVYAASCIRQAEAGMTVKTATDKVQARPAHSGRAADGGPSRALRPAATSGDCELEQLAAAAGITEPRFPRRSRRGAKTNRRRDRGRPRGLYPVRPLHPRLRRDPAQLCAGPPWQGISGRHRVRPQLAHGRLIVRLLRRMHGFVPHRRAHKQEGGGNGMGQGDVLDPRNFCTCRFFKMYPAHFSNSIRKPSSSDAFRAGEIICREGDFGSTAFYILEGKAEVFLSSPIAHVKTQGSSSGFFSRLNSRLSAARTGQPQRRIRPAVHSRSMPRLICLTTIPSPDWGPATCLAR